MRYALDGLRRRPRRTALAAIGIGLATALVIALLALSAGIEGSASRLAVASGVDLLATSANTSLTSGTFPPVPQAHRAPAEFTRADSNVASASPWLVNDLVFGNASLFAASNASAGGASIPPSWGPTGAGAVGWIPSDNAGLDTPALLVGTGFSRSGDPHYDNGSYRGPTGDETVLDQSLAAVLHVGPGSTVWVSPRSVPAAAGVHGWYENATAFRIVGLSGPFWLIPSALLGFFYLSELQTVDGGAAVQGDYASLVLVHLTDPTDPSHDQGVLRTAFPALNVLTLGNILGAVDSLVNVYRTFGTLVGAIGVVIAALFTSTVLLMSVDDRSQEIALLRAIGFRRATIVGYVFEESLWLSLLGLVVGAPLGLAIGYGLDALLVHLVAGLPNGFSFIQFDATVAASAFLEVGAIGVGAAVVPAARALTLPIAPELRAP
ncbi:MAG: ABC transporter permease [Thermoplasmata archaeon]|nr:ABC transporter permease [Thermoplasmata archaeon]MCI4358877.1 ABC transporter permease [Thermoplasmata archaeon]